MTKIGVYKITNKFNGRIYIGSTINLSVRKRRHFKNLKSNKHENKFLQADFNKFDETAFVFEIILETDCRDLLLDFEQSYLTEFWDDKISCYNISKNSSAPMLGRNHSKKVVENIRKRMIGNNYSLKRLSQEHKEKISKSISGEKNHFYGKKHSLKTKQQISNSLKGKTTKENESRKITFTVVKDNKIFTHTGLGEFCRVHNLNPGHFHEMITGKRKSHKGWMLP